MRTYLRRYRRQAWHIRTTSHRIAHQVEHLAQGVHGLAVAINGDQFLHSLLTEQPVHAGDLT
jgi:hypothetical protein